jgi:hypothetical protein
MLPQWGQLIAFAGIAFPHLGQVFVLMSHSSGGDQVDGGFKDLDFPALDGVRIAPGSDRFPRLPLMNIIHRFLLWCST